MVSFHGANSRNGVKGHSSASTTFLPAFYNPIMTARPPKPLSHRTQYPKQHASWRSWSHGLEHRGQKGVKLKKRSSRLGRGNLTLLRCPLLFCRAAALGQVMRCHVQVQTPTIYGSYLAYRCQRKPIIFAEPRIWQCHLGFAIALL